MDVNILIWPRQMCFVHCRFPLWCPHSASPGFPLTSPALLLDDATLGVGERCRVTRAMVGGLQPMRTGRETGRGPGGGGGGAAPIWEDAPL